MPEEKDMPLGDAFAIVIAMSELGLKEFSKDMSEEGRNKFEEALEIAKKYIHACRATGHMEFDNF